LGPRVMAITSPGSSSSDGIRAGAFLNDPPPGEGGPDSSKKRLVVGQSNPPPSSHCEVVDTIRFKG